MCLKEICFHTSLRNHLCDFVHRVFYFYIDWYSNSTQKLIFNGGFLYRAIFSFSKTESKCGKHFVRNIKMVSRGNHSISPIPV